MQKRKIIFTEKASKPIGPYSQAVLNGNILFVSGQVASLVGTSTIENETRQVMENIKAVVEEAGMTMNDIVKCSIFLTNLNNFGKVNEVYGKYFSENLPARETVQVAALPKNMNVEISVIAIRN